MSNSDIVRSYLEQFFSGRIQHSQVRELLTDDFTFRDPLMSANSADDYIDQLKQLGDELDLRAWARSIVGEGDIVAALVEFQGPAGPMTYSMWFTVQDGKFARIESIYDPRPFLGQVD
jgi:ketosteroid isomerase-like protein